MGTLTKNAAGAIATAALLFASASASAQTTDFNFENFTPLPSQSTNTLNVARSEVLPHLAPSFGFLLHYQDDPLQIATDDETFRLMDSHLKAELYAGLGLYEWVDIGVIMPIVAWQEGETAAALGYPDEIDSFAPGDLRIVPKIRFINPEWTGGFGAALVVPVTLPTGDDSSFNSDGAVRVEPRLALDWAHESGFKIAGNVGYEIRDERSAGNYTSGDNLAWGAGAEVPLTTPDILLQATIVGAVPFEDTITANDLTVDNEHANPMEVLGGLKFNLPNDLIAQVGGGTGITDGVGSPDFRVFAGLEWSPRNRDADDDGILDDADACPMQPEDKDDYQDEDGCPELDNDEDGINDTDDDCPMDAEDPDGFEDENGCPDPDNDADTVLDADDKCPLVAGPVENNGCPWGDADKDGILDNVDKCPDQAEDKDQFEDEDGCPDLDNDGDGILDVDDKCPLEPETINGNEDDDGCPDKGATKVRITEKKIEILEKVYFDTGKSTIKKRSYNILDQVASVLKNYPQIKKISVEGHTDSRGKAKSNQKLSDGRANAVRDYLIGKGVAADRLTAIGYGEVKPIADNKTKAGRDENRRVEFTIVAAEKIIEKTEIPGE